MLHSHVAPASTSSRYAIASCIASVAVKRQAPVGPLGRASMRTRLRRHSQSARLAFCAWALRMSFSYLFELHRDQVSPRRQQRCDGSAGALQSAGALASKATLGRHSLETHTVACALAACYVRVGTHLNCFECMGLLPKLILRRCGYIPISIACESASKADAVFICGARNICLLLSCLSRTSS